MKRYLVAIALLAAAGCGTTGIANIDSALPGMASARTPGHIAAETLPAYYMDRTHQKVEMNYLLGDLLSADVIDFRAIEPMTQRPIDNDSDIVSFAYRYNFGSGVREAYSDYEPASALWFGAGFGTIGINLWLIIPFHIEYDITTAQLGFAFPLGRNATWTFDGQWASLDDEVILDNYVEGKSHLTFYPTEDMYIGFGYMFQWYGNTASDEYYSNLCAQLGYLIGKADGGLELTFQYRSKGENGSDNEEMLIEGGLKWHMARWIALAGAYEDASGDFEDAQTIKIGVLLSPGEGVYINLGLDSTHLDTPDTGYNRLTFGVSYAF